MHTAVTGLGSFRDTKWGVGVKTDIKVTIPKNLLGNPASITRAIQNTLTMSAKNVEIDFKVTTQTWDTKPAFKTEKEVFSRTVSTDSKIYGFVNDGTSVRYALMSPDFLPKTRPGWIGSGMGSGRVLKIDKTHPRPGIKARGFDKEIKKKWEAEMPKLLQRAIDAEVK